VKRGNVGTVTVVAALVALSVVAQRPAFGAEADTRALTITAPNSCAWYVNVGAAERVAGYAVTTWCAACCGNGAGRRE